MFDAVAVQCQTFLTIETQSAVWAGSAHSTEKIKKPRLFGISHGRAKINRESFGDSGQMARIHAKKNQCKLCVVWAGSAH